MRRNTNRALAVFGTLLITAVAALPAQNTALVPAPFQPQRHEEFLRVAAQGNIDCLFIGDSITDWWRRAGLSVFEENFGAWKCANFGIAGDRTQGVLWRMENGELEGYSPKVVMLMIGTNNIGGGRGGRAGNTPEEIAVAISAIVTRFRVKFPAAKVLLLGIFPRGAPNAPQREPIRQINGIIAKLDDGVNVRYMDIGDMFLQPDGSIATDVMADGLHPTAKGYAIWAAAVAPTLKTMMGKN